MTDKELLVLLRDIESDRVERKESIADPSRIRQAICAFANDMPNHGAPGVLFVGVKDNGDCAGSKITDELLRKLSDMRSDGNILPVPSMTVQKRNLDGCNVAVVIIKPADAPPVRLKGQVWIRVGPRRATATVEEERRLSEKRRSRDLPFDLQPVRAATLDDLDLDLFLRQYLPNAFSPETLESNQRTTEQKMRSLRFLAPGDPPTPTAAGLLAAGKSPTDYIPGAYIQFLRIDGGELTDPILDQKEIVGPLPDSLRLMDELLRINIRVATDIRSAPTEIRSPDYPIDALQQLVRNAVMHRDYHTSNAPARIIWYSDRIEIQNPGGPYGQVTIANFGKPDITDYRNPTVAEIMKNLGYVQKFGMGIQIARKSLQDNGNPEPEFLVEANHVHVTVRQQA
jgi:ATP-dependent DNA helicase RecG